MLGAFFLRLLPAHQGLPYLRYWDEPVIASTALQMLKTGDFNPGFFHYGSLTIYICLGVDIVHFMHLMRSEPIPFEVIDGIFKHGAIDMNGIQTVFDNGWLWEVSHPSFYLWNRAAMGFLGALTAGLIFLLARRFVGVGSALLAAAWLAVLPFHIERSALVSPDLPTSFFAVLAILGAVIFVQEQQRRWLLVSLIACGLAAGSKYNGLLVVLAPALAVAFLQLKAARDSPSQKSFVGHWLALCLLPPVFFLVSTPYALLDMPEFLSQAGFEVYHYSVRGHGAVSVEGGWGHLMLQLERIAENFGLLPSLLAVAGVVLALRRGAAGWTLLVFPFVYFLFMAMTRVAFHRNLLVIYPMLTLTAAIAIDAVVRRLRSWDGKYRPWCQRGAVLVALVTALHVFLVGVGSLNNGWEIFQGSENRSLAVDKLNEDWSNAERVGIAAELRIHPVDLERLEMPYEVRPHLELACAPGLYDLVVAGVQYVGLWSDQPKAKAEARRLNAAALDVPYQDFGGPARGDNVTRLDGLSRDPVLRFFETRRQDAVVPEICAELTAEGTTAQEEPVDTSSGETSSGDANEKNSVSSASS